MRGWKGEGLGELEDPVAPYLSVTAADVAAVMEEYLDPARPRGGGGTWHPSVTHGPTRRLPDGPTGPSPTRSPSCGSPWRWRSRSRIRSSGER